MNKTLCRSDTKRQRKGSNIINQYMLLEAYNEQIIMEMKDIARKKSEGGIYNAVFH